MVTLVEGGGGGLLACGGASADRALAEATLPITVLSPGQAAHWWLRLEPLAGLQPARAARVKGMEALVVVSLCA